MESHEQDPQTYAIIGACMRVHRELGHGFLEAVYQEALAIEFAEAGIPFAREVQLPIYYRGRQLKTSYRTDFLCYSAIVVELKAVSALDGAHQAQVLNALKATRLERALLVNFGAPSLQYKRLVLSRHQALTPDDS